MNNKKTMEIILIKLLTNKFMRNLKKKIKYKRKKLIKIKNVGNNIV